MPNDGASSSTRRRRLAHLAGGIGVFALMLVMPGQAHAATAEGTGDCASKGTTGTASTAAPADLELDVGLTGGDALQFNFFRGREPLSDTFVLTTTDLLPPRGTELETIFSPMRRAGAGGRLPAEDVSTLAVVRNRNTVVVTVCIAPNDAGEGRYAGAVGFTDERVAAKPVPVVANLQYRENLLVLFAGFGAGIAALAVTYLAASDAGERFRHWIKQPRTLVGVFAALIATGGVYLGSFSSDPDWRFAADAKTYVGIAYAAALAALGTVLGIAAGADKTIAKAAAKVVAEQVQADAIEDKAEKPADPVVEKPAVKV